MAFVDCVLMLAISHLVLLRYSWCSIYQEGAHNLDIPWYSRTLVLCLELDVLGVEVLDVLCVVGLLEASGAMTRQ